jgi:hypothetical protein
LHEKRACRQLKNKHISLAFSESAAFDNIAQGLKV